MVQTLEVTGIAAARTVAISLGAYLGQRERLAVVTAVRLVKNSFLAPSMHALDAHSHAYSGHVLADHSHGLIEALTSGVAFDPSQAITIIAGAATISGASGGIPTTEDVSGGSPGGAIDGVSAGAGAAIMAGGGLEGKSITTYVVDSAGAYVLAATIPASGHFVNRLPGDAGPRVELGDAILATDILEITTLLQNESGGVF